MTQETSGFLSQNPGNKQAITNSVPRPLTQDSVDAMYLKDFLSRPVNIYTYSWLEPDVPGAGASFYPWHLFFSDSRIKNKLHNFSFIQCVLKLKFVINASPFYYGAFLCHYLPLPNLNPSTVSTTNVDGSFTQYTQRPHCWIYPQTNEGAEMTLPYVNFRHWTRVIVEQEFKDLGQMHLANVTYLQSANGTVGTGVTVSVFAWAEDVIVSGPTVGLAMAQAGDEYRMISTPSAQVAQIASSLAKVPVIGAFARATEIGAGAISKISHMFGFTNVPNVSDVMPFNPKPLSNFSDTSISFPVNKLTVDAKNELSISQAVAGLPDEGDPLDISIFTAREAFLCTVPWSTSDSPGSALFYLDVSPMLVNLQADVNYNRISPTPMAYCAALFNQWRGDIVIRVHVVASKFHKGRFRLIYDPLGDSTNNIVAQTNSFSGCINKIIDISEETDVEMTIPYSQATAFLNLPDFNILSYQLGSTPTFTRDFNKHNGVFMIRNLTILTSPQASSTIQLLISVRGASLEFANPAFHVAQSLKYSHRAAQGGFEYARTSDSVNAGVASTSDDELYKVVFGEKIVSMRQLIKRRCFLMGFDSRTAASNYAYQYFKFGRLPPSFGYFTDGVNTANGLAGGTFAFNWAVFNPMTWLVPCFAGHRGSVDYAASSASTDGIPRAEIAVTRFPYASITTNSFGTTAAAAGSNSQYARESATFYCDSYAGTTLTIGQTNMGFEFSMPMVSQYKFESSNVSHGTTRNSDDGSDRGTFLMVIRSRGTQYQSQMTLYCSAGADFNVIFFVNCPTVYEYASIPTA